MNVPLSTNIAARGAEVVGAGEEQGGDPRWVQPGPRGDEQREGETAPGTNHGHGTADEEEKLRATLNRPNKFLATETQPQKCKRDPMKKLSLICRTTQLPWRNTREAPCNFAPVTSLFSVNRGARTGAIGRIFDTGIAQSKQQWSGKFMRFAAIFSCFNWEVQLDRHESGTAWQHNYGQRMWKLTFKLAHAPGS